LGILDPGRHNKIRLNINQQIAGKKENRDKGLFISGKI
jgi:hypothetical protein